MITNHQDLLSRFVENEIDIIDEVSCNCSQDLRKLFDVVSDYVKRNPSLVVPTDLSQRIDPNFQPEGSIEARPSSGCGSELFKDMNPHMYEPGAAAKAGEEAAKNLSMVFPAEKNITVLGTWVVHDLTGEVEDKLWTSQELAESWVRHLTQWRPNARPTILHLELGRWLLQPDLPAKETS